MKLKNAQLQPRLNMRLRHEEREREKRQLGFWVLTPGGSKSLQGFISFFLMEENKRDDLLFILKKKEWETLGLP